MKPRIFYCVLMALFYLAGLIWLFLPNGQIAALAIFTVATVFAIGFGSTFKFHDEEKQ